MRYVVVCLLKGETLRFHETLVSDVCTRFKVQRQKLPAHFTIKAPFEADNIEELEKVTKEFCNINYKTTIKIKGFNSFRNNVVFMDIFPSNEAVEVHDKYIDELQKLDWLSWKEHEGKNKKFHCTIVSRRISSKFNEIWEYVNKFNPKFDLYFDNIAILIWKNGRWETYKEYKLGE
ncbi:2'-5' RNA ligase family protein [Clostridium ganghwense]|uniref:2'-5' RNA ligase family protein n=1 Tax=Clostridium ganghwense TaxID=312089 RepID=A0ABT4CQM8_9CLOT|nr:2'-5' RNA ligase family protein [Clostridium ganghwense]MCY6371352.1 2'-5' RNA ligase family protein [Clostridium ganghwense]